LNKEREGEILAILLSVLEGIFPIWSILAVKKIGAVHSYAGGIFFALIFFSFLIFYRKKTKELIKKEALKDLLLTSILITFMFVLIYLGLSYTTAGNMSVILLMQIFFSYLYFNIFGKEKMGVIHSLGALLMGIGALIVLFPGEFHLNKGDMLILLAAATAPIANLYQKKAREKVSSETVLFFRTIFAFPILIFLASIFEPNVSIESYREVLIYLILNGFLVLGIGKILWIEALHRISITKLSAMASFIPLFTLIFAYLFLKETPTKAQIVGAFIIITGSFFITYKKNIKKRL